MLREIQTLNLQLRYMHQQLEMYSLMHAVFYKVKEPVLRDKYMRKKFALKREINKKLDLLFELTT